MSDDLQDLVIHGGSMLGASGFVAGFMRWLQGRDTQRKEEMAAQAAQAAREEFLGLRSDVKHLLEAVSEHKAVFADVVEMKLAVKALHARHDDVERRIERLEARKK